MDPALPIQAVIVLAAIPVAAFALWSDYFCRSIEARKQALGKDYDPLTEGYRVRSMGFLVLIAELSLFLATSEARKENPLLGNLVFILAVLVQAAIQAGADKKIGTPATHPRQHLGSAAKTILWALGAALGYVTVVMLSVRAAVAIAVALETGTALTALLVICGAVFGLLAGLMANFALAPLYLRKALLSVSAPPPELREILATHFYEAKMREPDFFLIEPGRLRGSTAFIAGFSWGWGPFKPALFVSRGLLDVLSPAELGAVVRHEIAHFRLGHLERRLILATTLVGATFLLGVFATVLLPALLPGFKENPASAFLAPMIAFASFLTAFRIIGNQSRSQEFQADVYAVTALGSEVADLCSALRKLDKVNGIAESTEGNSHPATERRIEALSAYGPTTRAEQEKKAA